MKTLILILLAMVQTAVAQEILLTKKNLYDPLFPSMGKFNAGLISTYRGTSAPPPVLIADITYGVTKRISVGLVAGTTGTLALAGLRVNAVLFQQHDFRGIFKFNAIYYPGRDGKFLFDQSTQHVMPWMFTMGIADLEWKTKGGTRWSVGAGYLETHCIDGMLQMLHLTGEEDDGKELPLQFYNVFHGGVSIPVSARFFIRPEVVFVMHGLTLIESPEEKVSPINPYLNLVYSFGR